MVGGNIRGFTRNLTTAIAFSINLLSLLDKPQGGEAFFRGEKIEISFPPVNLRRRMHMVMENPLLFQTTVFKNLILGLKIRSVRKKLWPEKVKRSPPAGGTEGV